MPRKFLAINDSAWLIAETRRTPMQVGLMSTFRVPPGEPTFVADLVARWREQPEFAPPFNYLYKSLPVPGWSELPPDRIDLDYHLRHSALPAPGSQRELGVLVSRLHSSLMDRRYPLWECHVIEGLEEDRWAIYMKMHHSQVDGVGGIRLLKRTFSADPETRGMLPPWSIGTRGPDQSGVTRDTPPVTSFDEPQPPAPERTDALQTKAVESIKSAAGSAKSQVGSAAAVAGSLGRTYAATLTGQHDEQQATPFRAPKSLFNGRIHTPRRFATQSYSIDRMRTIAKKAGGSLNDVFLAISGGAVRRYLLENSELPDETLIANVPVSVRPGDGASVGNAVTFLFASLGTLIEDPLERIDHIRTSTRLGKERLPQVGGAAMDAYTAVLMLPFLSISIAGAGGHGRPASNLVISNVPGPAEPRYLDGSEMEEMFPVSLLFNGQALNITAVSYNGRFNVGYTGDRDSLPSLQKIAVYSGEELDALEKALGLEWSEG